MSSLILKTVAGVFALLLLSGCYRKPAPVTKPATVAAPVKDEQVLRTCAMSNESFAVSIVSCNCGEMYASYDTLYINLFRPDGGEILDHVLKISYPVCDSSYTILFQHQNRYYVGSMGPDPLLTDWKLYNSPVDTIPYDVILKGFYIPDIPEEQEDAFPPFDTLDFYKAYKRAVGEALSKSYYPDIAKGATYREFKNYKHNAEEILENAGVEMHRVILRLRHHGSTQKVIVFDYGHMG